jgi:hypothetical protein
MTRSRYAGVQGVPGEEGELFGMRNLFTLSKHGVFTQQIEEKEQER